jgi:hypothetical protein
VFRERSGDITRYATDLQEIKNDEVFVVNVWKGRRKTINQTFNQRILNSYTEAFVKHSNRFMDDVRKTYRGRPIKLLPKIWQHSVNAFCGKICSKVKG